MNCQRCDAQLGADEPVCPSCGTAPDPAQIIRSQALEVVVRHAISDPNWRTTCNKLMSVNRLSEEAVAAAAAKRGESVKSAPEPGTAKSGSPQAFGNTGSKSGNEAQSDSKRAKGQRDWSPPPGNNLSFTVPTPESTEQLEELRDKLKSLSAACEADVALLKVQLANVASDLEKALQTLQTELEKLQQSQIQLASNVDKELHGTTQPIVPQENDDKYELDCKEPDASN